MDILQHPTSSESQVSLESFWLNHVQRRNRSRLNKSAYCKKHGLAYHQYRYWEGKLSLQLNAQIKLVPVKIVHPPIQPEAISSIAQLDTPAKSSALCSLTLNSGAVLQIYNPVVLNTLIAILRY